MLMIYLSRIKMRGFKSFKLADIIFPRDFVCLAGPNASGKSNICDAIRFAFGERSLKALRARKVKDLIFHNARMAEVTLYFDGDEKHEIRRAIREDGKILYKLDGERTTRTSVLDLLKKFNIDESGRNTIAQGEVNRIINMNRKERREIIDSIAGISEFEDKKREAMRDLEVVGTRIREANLILGEKIGMLNELEKEREVALRYVENRKQFNNARGSIIRKEIEKFTHELEKAIVDFQKTGNSLRAKQAELAELDGKIKLCEQDKGACLNEIQARQQQSELSREIESLKLAAGKDGQEFGEKKGLVSRLESEIAALKEEIKKEGGETKKTEADFKKTEEEFNSSRSQRETGARHAAESRPRKSLAWERAKFSSLREELIRAESEIAASEELVSEKESSLVFSGIGDPEEEKKLENEMEMAKKEAEEAKAGLDALFEKEKSLNSEIAEMERRTLTLREKIATLRAQNPRLASNAVLDYLNRTKTKETGAGVHGALIDLMKFDAKYANAIEAAAGARLLYIVVDDANTATKLIGKIKENGIGRATFIPLKEVKVSQANSNEGLGPLVDYVKFDPRFEKAMQYALGETLLVSNMEEAKKIGVGRQRLVTLDGEIFEKSGVITGGKISTGIAAAGALAKLESELSELKTARESLFSELSSIREEMAKMRSQRAEKEVRAKSLEIELSAMRTEGEKAKREREEAAKKKTEIEALRAKAKSLAAKKGELERETEALSEKIAAGEKALAAEEEHLAKQNEESSNRQAELAARHSSLETRRDALFNEIKIRKTNLHKTEARLKQMQEERASSLSRISEIERRLSAQKDELEKKEKELFSSSRELEAIFRKMKESEEKIQEMGRQKGAISFECEKLSRESNALSVKKATGETKLIDLKAEFESFREFEFLDRPKDELMEIAKAADAFLSANQAVNLVSIELYEKKKAEIGGVKERMDTLGQEKDAIMKMAGEIDARKKETFFRTFYAVNDNFRKMFRYIPWVGEGYLSLDKPNEPFESGLFLKIKRGTKEIGLESLSGGENSLVALMFIFALQLVKPSPYYILDEVDSALDKENSKNLAKLIKEMSKTSQFILVTHNDMVMTFASAVFGVSRTDGASKVVGVKLGERMEASQIQPQPQP